jgi:hypothetical protein
MTNLQQIANWNQITSVQHFRLNNGDGGLNSDDPVSYPQDFLADDKGLTYIKTVWGSAGNWYYGNGDPTFKLSRLKNDWNTYFTQLQLVNIAERDWNREDLSRLTQLTSFYLIQSDADGGWEPGGPYTPLDSTEVDNIINQIAAGAGQTVSNGTIAIFSGGSAARTSASLASYNALVSKGWQVIIQ